MKIQVKTKATPIHAEVFRNGFKFQLEMRSVSACLYSQLNKQSGELVGYLLFPITVASERFFTNKRTGKEVRFPRAEKFPSPSSKFQKIFSANEYAKALQHFNELKEGINENEFYITIT